MKRNLTAATIWLAVGLAFAAGIAFSFCSCVATTDARINAQRYQADPWLP